MNRYQPAWISAQRILKQCPQNEVTTHVDCVETQIHTLIQTEPTALKPFFHGIILLGYMDRLPIDSRWYGQVAHWVGADLIESDYSLAEAVDYCSDAFKQGCVHGAVMQLAMETDINTPATLCAQLSPAQQQDDDTVQNCLHGVGHSLMMTATDLSQTLTTCQTLSPTTHQYACASGAMMEYMTGSHHHNTSMRELPCDAIGPSWQTLCYTAAGSYRQYLPGTESFAESFTWCAALPSAYQNNCSKAVAERVLIAVSGRTSAASTACTTISDSTVQTNCHQAVARWKLHYWLHNIL